MNRPAFDLQAHFNRLYAQAPRQFRFRARSKSALTRWQRTLRARLGEAMGLEQMARDLAGYRPRAEQVESVDSKTYVREKWYLWTEPDVPLPFWLLRPKAPQGRRPLAITPHGHNHPHIYIGLPRTAEEEQAIRQGQRDIAVQAVRQGYLTIAPTTRAFGETATLEDQQADVVCSCRTQFFHSLLVGRTPLAQRVWDMSRLIDWALARPDVDGRRIVMTGNSGGGTITLFASALDERITVSCPSSYFCTFAGSIGTIKHCDCNYIPGILRLAEMDDVAGLIAPRPLSIIAGRDDPIFPIAHVREAFRRLKRIYRVAGVPQRCRLYVGRGGHRYYRAGCWPFVKKWFAAL